MKTRELYRVTQNTESEEEKNLAINTLHSVLLMDTNAYLIYLLEIAKIIIVKQSFTLCTLQSVISVNYAF